MKVTKQQVNLFNTGGAPVIHIIVMYLTHLYMYMYFIVLLVKLMYIILYVAIALSRNKETEDNPEFSLSEGDDVRTEQALQEAFDQATGQQNQQQQVDQDQGMSLLQDSLLGLHSSGKTTWHGSCNV